MKYYSEEDSGDFRKALEIEVLEWPKVTTKKMFGCPCYQADTKLFTFIVTNGIVITQLTDDDREEASMKFKTSPFQAGKKTVKAWVQISINHKRELDNIIPFIKKSYHLALEKK